MTSRELAILAFKESDIMYLSPQVAALNVLYKTRYSQSSTRQKPKTWLGKLKFLLTAKQYSTFYTTKSIIYASGYLKIKPLPIHKRLLKTIQRLTKE